MEPQCKFPVSTVQQAEMDIPKVYTELRKALSRCDGRKSLFRKASPVPLGLWRWSSVDTASSSALQEDTDERNGGGLCRRLLAR